MSNEMRKMKRYSSLFIVMSASLLIVALSTPVWAQSGSGGSSGSGAGLNNNTNSSGAFGGSSSSGVFDGMGNGTALYNGSSSSSSSTSSGDGSPMGGGEKTATKGDRTMTPVIEERQRTASRELSKTVPLTPPPPTTPVPTLSGKDLIDTNSDYYVAMILNVGNIEFSTKVETFAEDVIGPALVDKKAFLNRVLLLDYCSLDSQDVISGGDAWKSTSCYGQVEKELDVTFVRWTFAGVKGSTNYSSSNVDRSKLGLFVPSSGELQNDYYTWLKFSTPTPTLAPTVFDRATSGTGLGLLIIFGLLIIVCIILFIVNKFCNKKSRQERAAAAAARKYGVTEEGAAASVENATQSAVQAGHNVAAGVRSAADSGMNVAAGIARDVEMSARREIPPAPGAPTSVAAPPLPPQGGSSPPPTPPPPAASGGNSTVGGGEGGAKHDTREMDLQY